MLLLCLVAGASAQLASLKPIGASAQLASLKPIGASQALDVSVSDDGAFELRFGGSAWFRGGDVKVRSDGAAYSLAEKTLKHVHTTRTTGADGLGLRGHGRELGRRAGRPSSPRSAPTRPPSSSRSASRASTARASRTPTTSSAAGRRCAFGRPRLRSLARHARVPAAVGNTSNLTDLAGGLEDTGPVCFFDDDAAAVVSAASSFMSVNHALDDDGALTYGLMGRVKAVPAGHVVETIVHFSKDGVNGAMDAGAALLGRYGKDRVVAEADFTVNYLGYSTDNGAFYYYGSEKNKTMEDTILDVHAYAEAAGIPYRYVLLDSWWYYQATDTGGVTNWTARPDVFPSGMRHVRDATGWPIVAHNRYWSGETVYAKQNGGDFDFIIEADGPATYLDAALRARAGLAGSDPALASGPILATSAVVDGLHYRYLFVANTTEKIVVAPDALCRGAPAPCAGPRRLRGERHGRARRLLEGPALRVAPTDEWTFEIHTAAPCCPTAGLGETAKWIAVSNDRVEAIAYDDAGVHVTVRGAAGERVDLAFPRPAGGPRTRLHDPAGRAGEFALRPDASALSAAQPPCLEERATALYDCGPWAVGASFAIPSDATSGLYFARMVLDDQAVGWRADASPKAVDLQHAVAGRDPALPPDGPRTSRGTRTTATAATTYGAFTIPLHEPFDKQFMNLSDPSHATKRAYKRSLNTPVITRDYRSVNAPFGAELAAIRFLERNGYVHYCAGADLADAATGRRPLALPGLRVRGARRVLDL
ncbi:hypothetical protein JL720_16676 [Aureococcus anophagefferens]|nr:hypothetical protein JL720_16676 [Aureococcus anophagefferens]